MIRNNLAWFLSTALDPELRQPAQAVQYAREAVDLVPKNANNWNTLGVAHYRNGAWGEAITALNKSEDLRSVVHNWLFLAMSHWQLGQRDEARQWYDKAADWMKNNRVDDELKRFRAEAEELLGISPTHTMQRL